jgi:hypothetical protein
MLNKNQSYFIQGHQLGVCGCHASSDCLCCDGSDLPAGCSSFLAYAIEQGNIEGEDVSNCLVVRVMQESEHTSFLYIDAQASDLQRSLLIRAFSGDLGGWLEQIARMLPQTKPPRIAPISLIGTLWSAELKIGQFSIRKGLKASPFIYQR